jgi:cobalt-zinc-cadmium efflux system outer membrane protein
MNHGTIEMPQWTSSPCCAVTSLKSKGLHANGRKILIYGLLTVSACFLNSASATSGPATTAPINLSIDQLVPLIMANNPNLRLSLMAQTAARAGITSAQAFQNPRIELARGTNTARFAGTNSGSVQVWGVSQFIENSTVRNARIDAARAYEKDSEQQARITRNELVAQVRLLAYQGLLHKAQSIAASEAVQLLEQVRERVRVRVQSGEAPRYEIIKADAEIINARERLLTASLMAEQILIELNQLAAGQLPGGWALTGDLSEYLDMSSLSEIQQQVRQHNPELAALQAQVLQSQAQLRSAQGSRWPGLELRYSQMRDPEVRQGQLSLGVQMPIIDTRSGPIKQASVELQRAETRLEGRQIELQQQILVISKSLEIARLRIEALSQGSVKEAEAALNVAQAAYRFGERGILDVLDAQRVLRSVRADLIDARYQLQVARIALEQLMGQHANHTPS